MAWFLGMVTDDGTDQGLTTYTPLAPQRLNVIGFFLLVNCSSHLDENIFNNNYMLINISLTIVYADFISVILKEIRVF